jgi:hypothetical protein
VVFSQLYAVPVKIYAVPVRTRAVDVLRLPTVAVQLDSAFAKRLDAVVLTLESLVSVYRKLSCAFLISIHWNCHSSSGFAAMLSDMRGFLPI